MLTGTDVASTRCSHSTSACSTTHAHSSSSTIALAPGFQHPPGATVDHDQPHRAELAVEAEPVAAGHPRVALRLLRPRRQGGRGVAELDEAVEHALGPDLVRGEVPEVLVHPVRHEAADDVVLPPRLLPDVVEPRRRRVPVVDHVVIVEDHRAGHDGQHPPLDLGQPRLVVQPRVLLEVGDVVEGWEAVVVDEVAAPLLDLGAGLRRRVVGVHLVADEQQQVGPLLGWLLRASAARGPTARRPRGPGRRDRTRASTAVRAARRRGTNRTGSAAARRRACGSRSPGTARRAAASTSRRRGAPRTAWSCRGVRPSTITKRVVVVGHAERATRGARAPRPCTRRRSRPRSSPSCR